MIVFHIAVAVSSIILTTVAFFAVSKWALRGAYASAGLTLASGMYLVWIMPANVLHLCLAGIVYLVVVSAGIMLAHRRLIRTHSVVVHR